MNRKILGAISAVFMSVLSVPAFAQTISGPAASIIPGATVVTGTGTNTYTLASSTVPRQLIFAHSVYTTSATVGNRYLYIALYNSSGVKTGEWETSAAMTASGTWDVAFMPGTYRETAFDTNKSIQTPFPIGLVIPAGYTLKIYDNANISASDSQAIVVETTQGSGQ